MNDSEYESVLRLDELESLLEDIEEHEGTASSLSQEERERMRQLGVADVPELRELILRLHARLDAEEEGS